MMAGKLGDLAAFTSAIALAMIALLIGYESLNRLFNPVSIAFNQAIPIAVVGLGINLLSAYLLRDDQDHHHGHSHDHRQGDDARTGIRMGCTIEITTCEPHLCT